MFLEGTGFGLGLQQQQETTGGTGPGPAQGRSLSHTTPAAFLGNLAQGVAGPDTGLPSNTLLPWPPWQMPVEFLLLLTVPVVDPDKEDGNWKRPLNCLHLVTSPLVLVLTLQSGACEYPLPRPAHLPPLPPNIPEFSSQLHHRVLGLQWNPGHLTYACAVKGHQRPTLSQSGAATRGWGHHAGGPRTRSSPPSLACLKILGDFTSECRSSVPKGRTGWC